MHNIVLIGFMGSGKTTIGKLLAKRSGLPFLDSDLLIEEEHQCSVSDLFAAKGEPYFRALEHELIKKLVKQQARGVLSVGGGLPVWPGNARLLRQFGFVVYLNASEETLIQRLRHDTTRPLLAGGNLEEKIHTLMQERQQAYLTAADISIVTDNLNVEQAAGQVFNLWQQHSRRADNREDKQ